MPLHNEDLMIEILDFSPEQMEDKNCVICLTNPKDSVFYPCGHQCICHGCSEKFKREARHQVCPLCRNRVKDIIKVYK